MDEEKFSTARGSSDIELCKIRWSRRELAFIGIGLVGLVLLIVAVILLGTGVGQEDTQSIEMHKIKPKECLTTQCLESGASLTFLRNTSVDPCDDFYAYACSSGIWTPDRIKPDELEFSTYHRLLEENEERVRNVLGALPRRTVEWSAELKMKKFYESCLNTYGNSLHGSADFINLILTPSGGWNVLGTMDERTYDVSDALKKVHVDFWTHALFQVTVANDWVDVTKNVIQIGLGETTLGWWDYIDTTDRHIQLFRDTRMFMSTVAQLVIRDSNSSLTKDQITQKAIEFAEDVFNFELQLSNLTRHTNPSDDPHAHENRVSISALNGLSDEFDWVSILTSMFAEAEVTADTKIVLYENDLMQNINAFIKALPNKKRTLNNYFTWRLMMGYVTDLGWEYVHANRVFWVARTGLTEFTGIPVYCFNKVKYHFRDALGALYIRDHLHTDDKKIIDEVVRYLKAGLQDRLNSVKWMEAKSRKVAIDKVKRIVEKVGYPTWMIDDDVIDTRYKDMNIDKSKYLGNLLEIAKFEKTRTNGMLTTGEDKSFWRLPVWEPNGGYDMWWNELLITAGLLQWPIYGKNFPKYYNFGSLGITLAHELTHAVDEIGGYYLANGTYFDWWTRNTTLQYNKRRACLESLDIQAGPYQASPDSEKVKIKIHGTFVARELAAEMAAVRVAYYAYKDWVADNAAEGAAPGLGLTNVQTMFLSYAQTQCFVRRDFYSITRAEGQRLPENIRLNQAMAHTPEFVEAFKCKKTSNMHAQNMCEVF